MTMKEMSKLSSEELEKLEFALVCRGEMNAAARAKEVRMFYGKRVVVVKGRKIPKGITGECFWMAAKCYSRYGDPWGIYTVVRIGIKDDEGNIWWTALDNVELA